MPMIDLQRQLSQLLLHADAATHPSADTDASIRILCSVLALPIALAALFRPKQTQTHKQADKPIRLNWRRRCQINPSRCCQIMLI